MENMFALLSKWPLVRQIRERKDGTGLESMSDKTRTMHARIDGAEVARSVCPYCGVGCGQLVYHKDGKLISIEGDPESPINQGNLCPKGAASYQLLTHSLRETKMKHRAPRAKEWQEIPLERAMDMVADRVWESRKRTFVRKIGNHTINHTTAICHLGGATLDIEENYLIRKLFTLGLGMVCISNQARIRHSSTVPGLGTSFGRGGATTAQQDLANADCVLIEGSSMAEAHPVGFRWVMKARERGATIIHVDPRFSRTSAVADIWVPIRAGGDIAFLGGIIRYIIENNLFFRDYVVHFTNASCILRDDFRDTDEGGTGIFSGWNEQQRAYDKTTWAYDGRPDLSFPERDLTLQHPRCVFQTLRRHFARYTPEMVEKICGISPTLFHKVAEALVAAS